MRELDKRIMGMRIKKTNNGNYAFIEIMQITNQEMLEIKIIMAMMAIY